MKRLALVAMLAALGSWPLTAARANDPALRDQLGLPASSPAPRIAPAAQEAVFVPVQVGPNQTALVPAQVAADGTVILPDQAVPAPAQPAPRHPHHLFHCIRDCRQPNHPVGPMPRSSIPPMAAYEPPVAARMTAASPILLTSATVSATAPVVLPPMPVAATTPPAPAVTPPAALVKAPRLSFRDRWWLRINGPKTGQFSCGSHWTTD